MDKRYKYIWNGRWDILEPGTREYDIIDMVDGTRVESYNSPIDVKYALKRLNGKDEDKKGIRK